MLKVDIILESSLHWWSSRELGVGPELGNRGSHYMRARMPEALQVTHLIPFVESLALFFVSHL